MNPTFAPNHASRSNNPFWRIALAALLALSICLAIVPRGAAAQADVQIYPEVESKFADEVFFRAEVLSETPPASALVFYRPEGRSESGSGAARLMADGWLEYRLDPVQAGLRAFGRVDYWFQITFEDGSEYTSETFSFDYLDNRFEWKTMKNGAFQVHWYEGDVAFAQSVADIAAQGFARAQTLLPVTLPDQVDIYLYAGMEEMQATLGTIRNGWEAGHADPDLKVAVIALPQGPDQKFITEQRVPHELMHILLYQFAGPGYSNLPTWFSEGLASLNELYPDPDYQILLENALQKNALIPIIQLCTSFPTDNSGALLSYAESFDFTRYIYRQYGASSLEALTYSYADGLGCARGAEAALGISLEAIEQPWQAGLVEVKPQEKPGGELLAWSALLAVVLLVPFVAMGVALLSRRGQREKAVALVEARSQAHG